MSQKLISTEADYNYYNNYKQEEFFQTIRNHVNFCQQLQHVL